MLVSTAIMAPAQFCNDCCVHLSDGPGRTRHTQAASYVLKAAVRDGLHWSEEHTISHRLNRKFRARFPVLLIAYRLRQNDLALRG
jgi:hypothetical protein